MKAMLRRAAGSLVASATLLLAPVALAEGEACYNDIDCPGNGGDVCGGDVCNWSKTTKTPVGDKIFYCNPAGTQPKSQDGWCTPANGDADCKCRGEGAKCVGTFCTFTKPSDAPGGGGTPSGGSGGSDTGGSTTGGTSAGTATGGAATAGAATAGTGTTPTTPPAEDDGGCSVSAANTSGSGAALALGLVGLGAMLARRRRA